MEISISTHVESFTLFDTYATDHQGNPLRVQDRNWTWRQLSGLQGKEVEAEGTFNTRDDAADTAQRFANRCNDAAGQPGRFIVGVVYGTIITETY